MHVTASVGIGVYPADGTDAEIVDQPGGPGVAAREGSPTRLAALAMAAATASHVALEGLAREAGPDGNQFPELPPARV